MRQTVRLNVLGAASVTLADGRPVPAYSTQPRRLAVLMYLTLARPRGLHARESLIAMLWPEHDETQGRRALRNALHALRQGLGDGVVITAGHGSVGIDPDRIECDLYELESDIAAGRLEQALARYEGELLQGFLVGGAPGFEGWLSEQRRRIDVEMAAAALALGKSCRERGDMAGAVRTARRALSIAPDSERALRSLVEYLDESGERPAALRAYADFAARLRSEYGAEPTPETVALARRVRAHAPSVPTTDAQAYVLYVRGTYLFLRAAHGGLTEDLFRSREQFELALARDPDFALALAGLSNFYASGAARNLLVPFHEHFGRAIELSRKALERDPTLAIPHVHFGVQAMYLESDWERAGREFALAVAADPQYAEGHRFRGVHLVCMGRLNESIAELREAVRLEPQMAIFRNSLADAYMMAGQLEQAIAELRVALELDPAYAAARERLLRCYERLGQFEEAIEARRLGAAGESAAVFARAFASGGPVGYLEARRRELSDSLNAAEARLRAETQPTAGNTLNPPELRLALGYAELGDCARAFAWEQRACATVPGRRRWFTSRPELAALDRWRGARG